MRILAIDVGDKKIGLAVGDTDTKMAFVRPPLLVQSWTEAWLPLQALISQENIEHIVVGWPINADGTDGPQTERVDEFIAQLSTSVSLPIIKRDERQTSQAVQREQQSAGVTLERGQEDSLAAQLLLESYLSEQ